MSDFTIRYTLCQNQEDYERLRAQRLDDWRGLDLAKPRLPIVYPVVVVEYLGAKSKVVGARTVNIYEAKVMLTVAGMLLGGVQPRSVDESL